jgi:SAM-dependent methyltransferase
MVTVNVRNASDARKEKIKKFWEMKAQKYPLPLEKGDDLKATESIIAVVKKRGVILSGKSILDIGCGTGAFTLPLALEAAWVKGLDVSEFMLAMFKKAASKHGVRNVEALRASWSDLDVHAQGFEKAFDIVWTAMSMAVSGKNDLSKMESCSRDWCVYVGWGNKRENALMEEVFKAHGIALRPPPGTEVMFELLSKMGRGPSIDFIETSWEWQGSVEEALEDIAGHVEMEGHGKAPDRKIIRNVIKSYAQDDSVRHTTHVEEGVIVWRST